MIYKMVHVAFALWVAYDAFTRKLGTPSILWSIGTLFALPLVLPAYLAIRPLKNGETREGGTSWNVLKNFAILWTFMMAFALITGLMTVEKLRSAMGADFGVPERIGTVRGIEAIVAVWFVPTAAAALLGLLVKNDSAIERSSDYQNVPEDN